MSEEWQRVLQTLRVSRAWMTASEITIAINKVRRISLAGVFVALEMLEDAELVGSRKREDTDRSEFHITDEGIRFRPKTKESQGQLGSLQPVAIAI